jgi:hypothetical protein
MDPVTFHGLLGQFPHKEFSMFRRFVSAAVVVLVLGGFVIAETYRGIVTSLDDKEVKVKVRKKGEKKAEEKTFKLDKKVKYAKKMGKDDAEDLSASDATKLVEKAAKGKAKGAFATIETSGEGDKEAATKITFMQRKGK